MLQNLRSATTVRLWKLETGSWKLRATGSWKLEAGSWKLETGSWKLEAGNWKLEAGSWKLETGNWKRFGTCKPPQHRRSSHRQQGARAAAHRPRGRAYATWCQRT
jgi:hypothetical protein